MRILFISYRDTQGAGSYTINCALNFLASGYNVKVLVAEKKTHYDFVIRSNYSKTKYFLNKVFFRLEQYFRLYKSEFEFIERGRYLINTKKSLHSNIAGFKPEVLFITWISEFVSIETIYKYATERKIKIFLWPVDKSLLFGGCHFNVNCNNYLRSCKNCPAVPCFKRRSVTKKYIANQQVLKNSVIVVYNIWFKNYISNLISTKDVRFLFYYNKNEFKISHTNERPFRSNEIHLVYGSSEITNKRKGFYELKEILNALNSQLKNIKIKVYIHFVGSNPVNLNLDNISQFNHGYINQKELKHLLSCTDIVISTSLDDIGPSFLVSAIEHGNVPFSYDIGIAKDLIVHELTGFIFTRYEIISFVETLLEVIVNPQQLELLRKNSLHNLNEYLKKLANLSLNSENKLSIFKELS